MSDKTIALIGNPNAGKSTLFNAITGLRQKTANFPGITVEKKIGSFSYKVKHYDIIDLPGTYSLFPNSKDEKVVCNILCNPQNDCYPDLIVCVCDIGQLDRHLLIANQLSDLGLPMALVLNMVDLFEEQGHKINIDLLSKQLHMPIIMCNGRTSQGIDVLIKEMDNLLTQEHKSKPVLYAFNQAELKTSQFVCQYLKIDNPYQAKLIAHHHQWLDFLNAADRIQIKAACGEFGFEDVRFQINETMSRFALLGPMTKGVITSPLSIKEHLTSKLDNFITHRLLGPIIFFALMFIIFQSIFIWAEWPMTLIESAFAKASNVIAHNTPNFWFTRLITQGIIPGLGGVLVFVPQIFLLFLFITLLEESGYMSRAVFMFDGIMQKVGLNGRSMVALISSGACAIPAIMSTRTIGNWKERLITIMVSPLIPCSARLPVYTVLIGLMIPSDSKFGIFNMQGVVFMSLYLLGIGMALITALIFKIILKSEDRSYLMIELPLYKKPHWFNVFVEVKDKVLSFITGAGKIILVISMVLWFMASYGPSDLGFEQVKIEQQPTKGELKSTQALESSFAGHIGKFIEPAIRPLGFDWKIGIALLTSFAAREVFIGTMATIYHIGEEDIDETTLKQKMALEKRSDHITPVYTFGTCMSLLVFYAFAMQCMSTLAVTKKETNGWKWPMIQFVFMTTLAYLASLIVYTFFK